MINSYENRLDFLDSSAVILRTFTHFYHYMKTHVIYSIDFSSKRPKYNSKEKNYSNRHNSKIAFIPFKKEMSPQDVSLSVESFLYSKSDRNFFPTFYQFIKSSWISIRRIIR